jgi:hypothetical protein
VALNGQIDTLSQIVETIGSSDPQGIDANNLQAAVEAIEVLRIVWPAKRDEIALRIRQILVTLEDFGKTLPEPVRTTVREERRVTQRTEDRSSSNRPQATL